MTKNNRDECRIFWITGTSEEGPCIVDKRPERNPGEVRIEHESSRWRLQGCRRLCQIALCARGHRSLDLQSRLGRLREERGSHSKQKDCRKL